MVECPFCGKECSSYHYLGQHIDKKDDDLHNGRQAEQVSQDLEQNTQNSNPENVVDDWKENNQQQQEESGTMQVNEIPIPDEPSDSPDYIPIGQVEVDDLSDEEIAKLQVAKEQGVTKIEDSDKPIGQRDFEK